MKLLVICTPEMSVEHHGKTFDEVVNENKGQDANLWLVKYHDNGIGWQFASENLIGNLMDNLTRDDYYRAYDKM